MRIFTKIEGKLASWEVDVLDYEAAIKAVRDEVGLTHKGAILALVKF